MFALRNAHSRLGARKAVLLSGLAALSGCAISPLATRTASFSTAATAAIAQTNNAYQLVNQEYASAQAATLADTFNAATFDANAFQPFLPAKGLAVRTKILNGLAQYATLLAEVSGNQPITDLQTQVTATGAALKSLQTDDFTSFKIDPTEQNAAQAAVVAFGRALIERARSRALPGILDEMNPYVQKICTVLETDIGTEGNPGLASELHQAYDTEIRDQVYFIRHNGASMSAEERRTEIELLPALVLKQQQADATLAATRKALAALAAAHAALVDTKKQKSAPAFRLEMTKLVENAQAIGGYYNSLSNPSPAK
ncbi:MAG: hypothetical protein ACRD3N_13825 [Terracidiphilus sp.]